MPLYLKRCSRQNILLYDPQGNIFSYVVVKRADSQSRPMAIHPKSDSELIRAYRDTGNTIFIGEFYKRYSHLVYIICGGWLKNEEDRKDAVMEIFEKLIDVLSRKDIDDFQSWLAVVTRNHCVSRLRKQNFRGKFTRELDNFENYVSRVESESDGRHIDREDMEGYSLLLQDALLRLNEAQRICVQLFYGENERKTYKEIALITGFTEKEVKSHIQNGKRNLKKMLNPQEE